ncbi:lytic transglycosylase domain-containing protein [Muribaculaceae bacterium Isolate-007 (NCI)]|uniref:Lytic transglycosylase domain-containing protein n=2 Tax=Muribaculum intestinale TaxID=1796646 RepID=A0A4S2G398_9BACT|nr:lytic transglycosylase domain-containing protein [Muribaculaceae bacterium Isolate-100 (HZI)]RXE64937.1 lytic transglycosylase domain-containing protein [Muribaculaceae bacterium Isolate-007 (NCI)]TGY76262.1 lytic transglycosylase domain-containing protein [Muribaculum intestinale]
MLIYYHKIIATAMFCGLFFGTINAEATDIKNGDSSTLFSTVVNPRIPSKVTFAGQTVDLDRVDLFERLDRELTSMAYTHGNTLLTIKRANRYFPKLIPILKKNGVPEDLIYLACIESTLNPRAYSPAKAAGLWQFIPSTGKEYGLEVNEFVDERYHPEKATQAACRYLKNALAKYGNWESVAASYNAGMALISKELDAQKSKSAYDLYLNDETSRYIFRLIAMKLIMENPKAYGYRISSDQLYTPVRTKTVEVNGPVEDWAAWAKSHGISYLTLRDFNPWIRAKSLPNKTGKTYRVEIPLADDMLRSTSKTHVYNPAWVVD